MPLNLIELETIGLGIAVEALDDIVNFELLEPIDGRLQAEEMIARFRSRAHHELFLVRVLDFTGETTTKSMTGVSGPCLGVLAGACSTTSFEINGSSSDLLNAVQEMNHWLGSQTELRFWLPSLDRHAQVRLQQRDVLFISGNQAKHNLARLSGVAKMLSSSLGEGGRAVSVEEVILALDDFRGHLQKDHLAYYSTWIVEMTNNLRWGLHEYLTPIYNWSFESCLPEGVGYKYRCPPELENEIARAWFWRLMESVRRRPYVGRFNGSKYLRRRSSIERG